MSDPPAAEADALLPVLVCELVDEADREAIERLADARATALVPLEGAPVDASLHVLEVTSPGAPPLVLLAEPVGAPTERGFPLRLHPFGSAPRGSRPWPAEPDALPSVRAARARPATLTRNHTSDLLGRAPDSSAVPLAPRDLLGREIGGKLLVEEEIGVGGMGAVYRARHKQLGTNVALKVLHERYREDLAFCARFHAEALVVSQLDHLNAVRILDYGQEPDGLLYIAMEYVSGEELTEVLRREGTLPLPRVIDIGMQIAAALGHAHARGIVHRDVKPSNIMLVRSVDDEGRAIDLVKVCDFGIAARAGASDVVGTPSYMSPEQCAGGEIDGRSDLYALGVILYELATGQVPFAANDPLEVVRRQREEEPAPPSRVRPVDGRLEALIMRLLRKAPAERPASAREVRGELRALRAPPSLDLHARGAGKAARESGPPPPMPTGGASPPTAHEPSVSAMPAVVDVPGLAFKLMHEPVSTLRAMFATPETLVPRAQALAAAMRLLLDTKELASLAQVLRLLEQIARSGAETSDTRAVLAARLVRTLQDPARLGAIAEGALAEHDEAASALLGALGLAAAHALYAARLRVHATPSSRGRFVDAMRRTGDAAWPLLVAVLPRHVPDGPSADPRLAEDLLRAMPLVPDEAMGGIVAKCLRWGDAALRRAAIPPLVAMWRERARPLLLAVLLKDTDEGARVSAIKGLVELHAVDEHVVRKAEEMLSDEAAPAALRAAIAEALASANEEARPLAETMLRRAFTPKSGVFGMRKARGPSAPPVVVLAMARSLAALGGVAAARLVEDVGRQYDDPLKTQLLGVVGARA